MLQAAPGVSFGLGGDIQKISLRSPGAALPDTTTVSLDLFHTEIDGKLRNQRMLPDRAAVTCCACPL